MNPHILIIGLGPTGAVLAGLLGLLGVRTHVLERDREIHALPRAVHFDDEVMRVFQTLGVAGRIAQVSIINKGMQFRDADGQLLLDWPRPQTEGPQGWHPSWRFHQPDLDRILRDRLADFPSITTSLDTEAIGLTDHGSHVSVETADGPIEADFVIGCDGARSITRAHIGGGHEDLGFDERWLVVDLLLKRERPGLGDVTVQHCHPENPATYVRGPGNRRRWEIRLGETETVSGTPDEAEIWRRLSPWITPEDAGLERAAVYRFHSVLAERWRKGRVLIAGDAAHQTPPFMGQGMCAGVRDAANLAWKLALVVEGKADANLLDTYQSERAPHARTFIEGAVRLGRLVNASDPDAALRNAFRQPDGSVRMASILPGLGPGLSDLEDPLAGQVFPQPRMPDGSRMDDAIGYRPALLVRQEMASSLEPLQPKLDAKGIVPLIAPEGSPLAEELSRLDTEAVLLRPDRYVLGIEPNLASQLDLWGSQFW